jgi:hypothetical protein
MNVNTLAGLKNHVGSKQTNEHDLFDKLKLNFIKLKMLDVGYCDAHSRIHEGLCKNCDM